MNPGTADMRSFTFRGLIPEARELLIILYGSFDQYINAVDYATRFTLEDACVLYSRSIEHPICAIRALEMLNSYAGEKGDDALVALHTALQLQIAGRDTSTCDGCLLSG